MESSVNSFSKMTMDVADYLQTKDSCRRALNMRVLDLDGTSFVMTNLKGTVEKFQLTDGFLPVVAKQYNNVAYIVSYNSNTLEFEVGSYPSPDLDASGTQYYRPFNNLDDGPLRTVNLSLNINFDMDIELQVDYDDSVNVILTQQDRTPRIINSRFDNEDLTVITSRTGAVNSNSYTSSSIDTETQLVLYSEKILGLDYGGIETGGTLKYGNYTYIFKYQTEDFAETDIVGQTSIFSIFDGDNVATAKGGSQNEDTNKQVRINVSNIDTVFKYLKMYCVYSSGEDGLYQQALEFTQPIEITGETMTLNHTGYEEVLEISQDVLNQDYFSIEGAKTNAQVNNYLFLGNIKEFSQDYSNFAAAAQLIEPFVVTKDLPYTGNVNNNEGYLNPENIYRYLGYMSAESYPWGVVFILPGGKLSPAFPISGRDFTLQNPADSSQEIKESGIVRMPDLKDTSMFWEPGILSDGNLKVKSLNFDFSNFPQSVQDATLGFFMVRGERVPDRISQGYLTPVVRMPSIPYYSQTDVYFYKDFGVESQYRFVPIIDNLMEASRFDKTGDNEFNVSSFPDGDNTEDAGFMPIHINDIGADGSWTGALGENYTETDVAYMSADWMCNFAKFATELSRPGLYVKDFAKMKFSISETFDSFDDINETPKGISAQHGFLYDMSSFEISNNLPPKLLNEVYSVPAKTYSGTRFISRTETRVKFTNSPDRAYIIRQAFNSYFGFNFTTENIPTLVNKGTGELYPSNTRIGGNLRVAGTSGDIHTSGTSLYNGGDSNITGAVLVNIYPQSGPITDPLQLYPSQITYKQVGPRLNWDSGNFVELGGFKNLIGTYGGDCYIGKIYHRLNLPLDESTLSPEDYKNHPSGFIMSFIQESEYNPALRRNYQFDNSEEEERSFFPFRGKNNVESYREYRLPDSIKSSEGYTETETAKSFFKTSSNAPLIENRHYNRIIHSGQHIPNSFRNGFRVFGGLDFRDYDSSMGQIIRLLNHNGQLMCVFEHGIGIAPVNQRVQTGQDTAGAIFVEPSSVLPPTFAFASKTIGAQSSHHIIQTPGITYGVDAKNKKLWAFTDKLDVISVSKGIASFINEQDLTNVRLGYNQRYNEVLFTTNNWTLCYKEGLYQFTSFYSFKPSFYLSISDDLLSYQSGFNLHDIESRVVYGSTVSYVEFVVNEKVAITKVLDYMNIVSNNVPPEKIEFYTQDGEEINSDSIDTAKTSQYSKIEYGIDQFFEEYNISYRDKKFAFQVPNTEIYNGKDVNWGEESRIRDKYVIVRITYNTEEALRLMAAISFFRFSQS